MVSGHNATDKTPMYEIPLIFVFGVLGLGTAFFVSGFWVLAFVIGILSRDRSEMSQYQRSLSWKEIPAGFSTLNERFEYENVTIQKNELHVNLVMPVTGCVV